MQQYTSQALSYANQYLTMVKQWWWPNQQLPQTPLEQLRFFLLNSGIQFQTKHSDKKIIVERLCMMYNELITTDSGKYGNFKPTIQVPIEYVHPQPNPSNNIIPNQDSQNEEQQLNKAVVSVAGQMKIKMDKVKCNLLVTLVFHEQIQDKLPLIYIRNPDTYKTQPNFEHIRGNIYAAVLGGVSLSESQMDKLSLIWKEYKPGNLLHVIQYVGKLLHDHFPFVKRYTTFQQITKQSPEYKISDHLHKYLQQSLQKIQELIILKQRIESQRNWMAEENRKIKAILAKESKQENKYDIDKIISMFKVETNQEMLELVCGERACLDVIRLLENQVEKTDRDVGEFYRNLDKVREWSGRLFQIRFKLAELVSQASRQEQ